MNDDGRRHSARATTNVLDDLKPSGRVGDLQRALAAFAEALSIARSDARTWWTFLDILAIRVAREHRLRLEREERPS